MLFELERPALRNGKKERKEEAVAATLSKQKSLVLNNVRERLPCLANGRAASWTENAGILDGRAVPPGPKVGFGNKGQGL